VWLTEAATRHFARTRIRNAVVQKEQQHLDLALACVRPLDAPHLLRGLELDAFRQRLRDWPAPFSFNALGG
jgi:hypothetical protein